MAGKRPIVIVQSSGLTNMASCITSLLVPYGISFPIITSWRTYHPGDSEIQHEHLATHLPDLIQAYGYEYDLLSQSSVNTTVSQINRADNEKRICVLKSGTFSDVTLAPEHKLDHAPTWSEYPRLERNV